MEVQMPGITTFIVPGRPRGKARPRLGRAGHVYSPDAGNFQSDVKALGLNSKNDNGAELADGPVEMYIVIERRMPKAWSKKKKAAQLGAPAMGRPDINNVASAVFDALEGIYYYDDLQIGTVTVSRTWADRHATTITVKTGEGS
jgi:Holliday junction resolvase RusA-like endonuclease